RRSRRRVAVPPAAARRRRGPAGEKAVKPGACWRQDGGRRPRVLNSAPSDALRGKVGPEASSRRQGDDGPDTRVIETRPKDAHHLGKGELAGAVAGRNALEPPLVAKAHYHLGHLGVGRVDQVEATEH